MRWGSEGEEAVFECWWDALEEGGEDDGCEENDEKEEECAVGCPPEMRGEGGEAVVR